MADTVLETARAAYAAGICVVPPRDDGSKRPIEAWKEYQAERPSKEQMGVWYGNGRSGIGFVCGAVSGNLELFEFDDQATYEAYLALAAETGLAELVDRVEAGYLEVTPGGGVHWFYRCDEIAGNTKLARRRDGPNEIRVLIETRGQGGYAVVAPSNGGVHPSGKAYRLISGGAPMVATLTPTERDALWELARTFDQIPRDPVVERAAPAHEGWVVRPGEAWAAETDWADILEPHGWRRVCDRGETTYWRRPGKDRGVSATTNHAGSDLLYVFSTSTEFDAERGYGKFGAWARIAHGSDFTAAAIALHEQGYGQKDALPVAPAVVIGAPFRAAETKPWPEPMGEAAFVGLAGETVRALRPYTEADPHGLLVSVLTAFGCGVNSGPYLLHGATAHWGRLFALVVGNTGDGRKGESWWPVRRLLEAADKDFRLRIKNGLSSGEGLIAAVKDPEYGLVKGQTVMTDPGVEDKRLLVVEAEFARVMAVLERDSNTLGAIMRDAWDTGDLSVLTKSPTRATAAHICVIGQITPDELLAKCDASWITNGFLNRFLVVMVRRSQILPIPAALDGNKLDALARTWSRALTASHALGRMGWSEDGRAWWETKYAGFLTTETGKLGAMKARAAPIVLRVALTYALMDGQKLLAPLYLDAAEEVWRYSERSVEYLFGESTGNATADVIYRYLREHLSMRKTDIYRLFNRNKEAHEIDTALIVLKQGGLAYEKYDRDTGGRPSETWYLQ